MSSEKLIAIGRSIVRYDGHDLTFNHAVVGHSRHLADALSERGGCSLRSVLDAAGPSSLLRPLPKLSICFLKKGFENVFLFLNECAIALALDVAHVNL